MFPVIINDGQTPLPESDICYIVAKEGIFLKKKLGVMESIAPVKNISILESVQTAAKMHISKIPAKYTKQIINFFKGVYKEYSSEAIVLLFYNKEQRKHKIVCPIQEVSPAAADYNKAIVIEGYDMIGTIHSHAGMSAFHSGVDDNDEKSFDGLHITFGNMGDDDISISASIVANGFRVIVDPKEYINNLVLTVDIDEEVQVPHATTYRWDKNERKMVPIKTSRFYTKRKFDQRYQVKLSRNPSVPKEWYENVSRKVFTYGSAGSWSHGWYGHSAHYESDYWKGWTGHGKGKNNKNLPATVKSTTIPAKKVVKKSPCDTCNFKSHKINMMIDAMDDMTKKAIMAWAIEQLEIDAKSKFIDDDDEFSYYYCCGCDESFSFAETEDAGACCPTCQTDDNLFEITLDDYFDFGDEPDGNKKDKKDFITCPECSSTFPLLYLNDGHCPTCRNKIEDKMDDTVILDDCIQCPSCGKFEDIVSLVVDSKCQLCGHDFNLEDIRAVMKETTSDEPPSNIVELKDDEESAKKAMEAAAEADKHIEKVPLPDNKKTGVTDKFFSMFGKEKGKK